MLRVLDCLANEHDYRLVLLAALICATATLTAFHLYDRAKSNRGGQRAGWLFLTGVATGAGIWATHFVAMLAFQPGLPVSYDPSLTGLSLIIAVAVTTMGFAVGSCFNGLALKALGGGVIGAGIVSMHYTGMKAFLIPGRLEWDAALVHSSVVIGLALSAAALIAFEKTGGKWKVPASAAVLTLAICGMHFTAMGAAIIVPDPTVFVVPAVVDNSIMALAVAGITMLVVFAGVTAVLIDSQATRESVARAQELVDATIEGVVIAQDGKVQNINRRVSELCGYSREDLIGEEIWPRLLDGPRPSFSADRERREASLKTRDGKVIPVEVVYRPFTTGRKANEVYAIRDIRERVKAEQRIRYLAHNDLLTGLPNRTSLTRELSRVLRAAEPTREPFAVLTMDLDRFKDVNDVLGHAAGDAVLTEVSQRMIKAVGELSYLARLGGDEFVVVQSGHLQPEAISMVAASLHEAFTAPFEVDSQTIQLGLSTGVAVYPQDGVSVETLLSNADNALFRAKSDGGNRSCFFETDMDELQRRRRKLAQALHSALPNEQLQLNYQPQVALPSAEVIGFEALVRWRHPDYGLVSPADFIPIAEETGLIVPIGEWVLRTACAEAARWPEACTVAVNLSPKQFQQDNFPALVRQILDETGLPASRLELEVTESTLFAGHQRALALLRDLKALGVSIAMDDFGTGYSSLSTLQSFPFDKIKIDRGFVSKVESAKEAAAIVKSVLSLGRSLGIPVLAEGVETESQLDFLVKERCAAVQGYYFGKPHPPERVRKILESGSLLRYCLNRLRNVAHSPANGEAEPVRMAEAG